MLTLTAHKNKNQKITNMTSISIIEDIKMIRENVSKYISFSSDMEINRTFGSVEDFLRHKKNDSERVPNILLLDIGLPGMSGLEGIPLILEKYPDLDIVMLTSYEEEETVLKALCLGAVAYISKKSTLAQIAEGLRIVKDGGSYMSPMIAREVFNHFGKPKASLAERNILSERQLDILTKLVAGKTYKTIGADLGVTDNTVKCHIKKIYKALHVKNKAEAISKYLNDELK